MRTDEGFELFFNRDEAITRLPEEPARSFVTEGVRVLAPFDGESGGTWIIVNEFGLCVTLLNAYVSGPERAKYTTRGRVPLTLGACRSQQLAGDALAALELEMFRPFHLALVAPGVDAWLYTWDGEQLTRQDAEALMPLASSGADHEVARTRRRKHLADLSAGAPPSADTLARFHASHEDGPSPWSPCMHAQAAETRSLCRVAVDATSVRLTHTPGAPCRTAPGDLLGLERRR